MASSDKIRVAFFAEILIDDFDGAARTMFQLINRIPADRFEFLFICGNGPNQIQGFDVIKVPSLTIPFNKSYKISIPALTGKKIARQLDTFKPHVVHIATPSFLGDYALEYAKKRNIAVITIYHTHFISYIDYYLSTVPLLIAPVKRNIRAKQNKFYNACQSVYVPSKSTMEDLIAGGVEPGNLKLWQRGIDGQLFSPSKKNRCALEKITGNENPTILFASRLVWEKNLQTLIAVYKLAQEKELAYNFLVVGDGVAKEEVMKQMPKAIFLGHTDHDKLAVIYASSSVFIFTSITETFGNVVLEAMASGLPCVVADGGGSKDFITHGVNGFRCRPTDADDFLQKLALIIEDTALAKKISNNALVSSSMFNWEYLSTVYFDDLEELAQSTIDTKQ